MNQPRPVSVVRWLSRRSLQIVYRRELFSLVAGAVIAPAALAASSPASPPNGPDAAATPFDASTVRNLARELASKPYQPPETALPDAMKNLDYSAYQRLRFDPAKALWRGDGGKFTVQFFSRGYLFKDKVEIAEVENGHASPIRYAPDMFDLSTLAQKPADDIGFAGFRVHYPLNRPDYNDEVCAFLGASYFRAVARGQGYGLSARGLAIKTGDPGGEEFPVFKRFWLERPAKGNDVLVIHALLDAPSAAAAFRFTVRPGAETVMDTEMALYPRVDITQAGLAPMTSMFLFDANNRTGFDDYRDAVHDSNGLGMLTGQGERIWRTLNNPRTLQISAFGDTSPRGFGLMQRERSFLDYQDLEAVYEKRPSLWIEPLGDWGQGAVKLVEIPSEREMNDNIVAFWQPKDKLAAKGEYLLSYRLHWCWEPPGDPALATVTQARCGLTLDQKNRQFIVDFAGGALANRSDDTKPDPVKPDVDLGSDKGKIENTTLQLMPGGKAWRLSFQLATDGEKIIETHARLLSGGKPVSETWIYRWTA
jgi:glucans biosynthesis protein